MAKVQSIKFGEFMDGSWKFQNEVSAFWRKAPNRKYDTEVAFEKRDIKKLTSTLVKTGVLIPLAMAPKAVFAQGAGDAAGKATEFVATQSLHVLGHALDPIVQILVAISLPVASIVMIGGCFYFMFGNSEKAWSSIQNAGLGYILIQLSPLFIKVLEQIGNSL